MRNIFYILISLLLITYIYSCDNDEGLNTDPNFRLSFSIDTLSFDTLFTGYGSTTMQFKVYNKSEKKVNIDRIYLQDPNSAYRINVNGVIADNYNNIDIGAKDSLFVFVEVELEPNDTDNATLLEDILVFDVNEKLQGVVLSTWAQDVILVNRDVTNSQNWTGNRPYLIENQIAIAENTTLTIEEGARLYFRKNAGLDVHGGIKAEGSFDKPIYFGSTRLEDLYKNVPGQWDGITIHPTSTSIELKHFILEDGINGLKYQGSENENGKLQLEYGVIRNFTQNGISATNVDIMGHDLLLLNCGEECLSLESGALSLYHSTFYNSWAFNVRTAPIIRVLDSGEHGIIIGNSIIWGSQRDEMEFDNVSGHSIDNSLVKLGNSLQEEYSSVFTDCIFNENPEFTSLEDRIYTLLNTSPCINTGRKSFGELYPIDLNNTARNIDDAPDMGAYEYKELDE